MGGTADDRLREAFRRLSRGRMEALDEVWRECAEPMHNYAFALTASHDEADDLLTDVPFRVARRGWRLGLVRYPRAYLFAAVRNAVLSRARQGPCWRRRAWRAAHRASSMRKPLPCARPF